MPFEHQRGLPVRVKIADHLHDIRISGRFQAKWRPVLARKTHQVRNPERRFDLIETEEAPAHLPFSRARCRRTARRSARDPRHVIVGAIGGNAFSLPRALLWTRFRSAAG
jgi:hypothetical protein